MLYQFFEWNHAAMAPLRAFADVTKAFYQNPLNPVSRTEMGRGLAAMAELFERTTRVYGKPEFGLDETVVGGLRVPVVDRVVWKKPFCRLLHFERALPEGRRSDPRILLVAPMSGHYATLLRGTVEALLPYAEVYITDWTDARLVPVSAGRFDLDDYVDHVIEILQFLGPNTHVVGVCQPAVPVLMAAAVMEARDDACAPATMTLMGGPIDTRINPTAVNRLAQDRGIGWFRENVIMKVPFPQPGFLRDVYPGFLQLTGFMSMNLDRHLISHKDFFWHLVKGDGDSAEKHRTFYDEYNAVMDLTAEFYLQTVEEVFIKHSLPKGEITHRGTRIDASKIRRTALMTIEGENDDISGLGQTEAAHRLCSSIPDDKRVHYVQKDVGHYGVFNGSRFRSEIAPRIVDFALTHGRSAEPKRAGAGPAKASEELTDRAPTAVSSDSVGSAVALGGLAAPEPLPQARATHDLLEDDAAASAAASDAAPDAAMSDAAKPERAPRTRPAKSAPVAEPAPAVLPVLAEAASQPTEAPGSDRPALDAAVDEAVAQAHVVEPLLAAETALPEASLSAGEDAPGDETSAEKDRPAAVAPSPEPRAVSEEPRRKGRAAKPLGRARRR